MHRAPQPLWPRRQRVRAAWRLQEFASPAVVALAATLIVCPMLLGGALPWAMIVTAIACAVSLSAALREAPSSRAVRSDLAPVLLLGLVWTVVQALPLPCAVVGALAPESVEQYGRALALLGSPSPTWCALSRDPGATYAEVIKGCAIVSAYLAASLVARQGRREVVFAVVALSSTCMALVAVGHSVVGAERVFGLYAPSQEGPVTVLGPLVNPNNLGGFIAMGAPVALGLWEGRGPALGPRLLWLLAAILCIVVALSTLSRGAVAAAMLTTFAYVAIRADRRFRGRRSGRSAAARLSSASVVSALAMVGALGLGLYAGYDSFAAEVRDADISKFGLLRAGAEFALRAPFLGVGRGAFSSTFVEHAGTTVRFDHAENFVVQWAAEWGLPFALFLAFALGRALWFALRRARNRASVGAGLGLASIALQNQVDLGFELVGIAVVVAALAGALLDDAVPLVARVSVGLGRLTALALGGTVIALALLGPRVHRDSTSTVLKDLAELRVAGERAAFHRRLIEAVPLHPSEPSITLEAAVEATEAADPIAGRWISRTMALAPLWGQPHALAVSWLWHLGRRDQAMLELREASERSLEAALTLGCHIAREDPARALAAAPAQTNRKAFLDAVARCAPEGSSYKDEANRRIAKEYPDDFEVHLRLVQGMLRAQTYDAALDAGQRLVERFPQEGEAWLAVVSALTALQRTDEALALCTHAAATLEQPFGLVMRRMALESETGRHDAMRATAEELRRLAAGQPTAQARALAALAHHERNHGNLMRALTAAQDAHRLDPQPERLELVAQLLRALGDRAGLFRVLSEICATRPGGSACSERDALTTGPHR